MDPNRYTTMSLIPPEKKLDLKDAFFSLPLAEVSKPIFVFKWRDPREAIDGNLPGLG